MTAAPALNSITTAARHAMQPPLAHQFGITPSVPAATLDALHLAHREILRGLHHHATAARSLRDWTEAVTTMSMIAECIGYGVDEMSPHIDDVCEMTRLYRTTGRVSITPELAERLDDCAEVIDAILALAPHEVVVACAEVCEGLQS